MEDRKLTEEKYRVNKAITARQVRLVDQNGEAMGIVSLREALRAADDAGMDLVEIAAQADPPVCKILNYGKLKYDLQKKKAEAKRKQKVVEIKEVKFTPAIEKHDYQVKLASVTRFIGDGNKVKITLRFRGRELSRQETGVKLLNDILEYVKGIAKCESNPQLEGRQMVMMLSPIVVK